MKANQIPFYVVTCDKTAWILKSFAYLANKFWPRRYDILGFSYCPDLPDNFEFISMAERQVSINSWTKYIYDYLRGESCEFVFFGLDDYLFIDGFNERVFNYVFEVMKLNKNIVRYEMSWGAARKKKLIAIDQDMGIFKYDEISPYRISCQVSLWRTEYLLKFLNNYWTPWEFEILGSKHSNNDGEDIICTVGNYALRWIEESSLSNRHPEMVNVLGLRHELVDDLLSKGFVQKSQIQYGMSKGEVPIKFDIKLAGKKYEKFYL